MQLLRYIENQVEHYASFNRKRGKAIQLTKNLLFVLVRLFGDQYTLKQAKKAQKPNALGQLKTAPRVPRSAAFGSR